MSHKNQNVLRIVHTKVKHSGLIALLLVVDMRGADVPRVVWCNIGMQVPNNQTLLDSTMMCNTCASHIRGNCCTAKTPCRNSKHGIPKGLQICRGHGLLNIFLDILNIFLDILNICRELLEDIFQVRGAACCLKEVLIFRLLQKSLKVSQTAKTSEPPN